MTDILRTPGQLAAHPAGARITVLPHKLDTNRYPTLSPSPQESLNVIYQGVEGHLENLLPIVDALKQAADQYPGRIEFHFFGRGLVALGKHPAFHFHPAPAGADEWGDAIRQIRPSLALLPLLDASKSVIEQHAASSGIRRLRHSGVGKQCSSLPGLGLRRAHGISGR